jgi:hypothetical protein
LFPCHALSIELFSRTFFLPLGTCKASGTLLVFLAIGDEVFILFGVHVIVGHELLLLSLLVIVDVNVDIEATEKHLKWQF